MGKFQHFAVSQTGDGESSIAVVEIYPSKLSGPTLMQELAQELNSLLEELDRKDVLLNLSRVEFVASAALNRLINFQKRVHDAGGKLKLCNLRPEIASVFAATRLNQVFDIRKDKNEGLASY